MPRWRTHSCVPCRDSSRHLLAHGKSGVGTSADAAPHSCGVARKEPAARPPALRKKRRGVSGVAPAVLPPVLCFYKTQDTRENRRVLWACHNSTNSSKSRVPWLRWASVLIAAALLLAFPASSGLNAKQDHLLAVFVATIVALVAQPVRMGVSVVVGMTLLALTRTLPPATVLSGFANLTVWLSSRPSSSPLLQRHRPR